MNHFLQGVSHISSKNSETRHDLRGSCDSEQDVLFRHDRHGNAEQ